MATRLYLPSSGAAAISPAFDAGWENTSIATRLAAVTTPISSTMTTVTYDDSSAANQDILFRQWVYGPISAQTLSAQTVKLVIRCQETNGLNNLFLAWTIRVCSSDGSTFRGTVVGSPRRDTQEIEEAGMVSRVDSLTSTEVTSQAGDYLVIEVGVGGDPTIGFSHDSTIRIGDSSGSDLADGDDEEDDNNPWVEFANTISTSVTATGTIAATLQKALFSGSGLFAQNATGTIAATLRAATFSGSGNLPGTAAATLQRVSFSGTGTLAPTGTMHPTLRYVTFSGEGNQPVAAPNGRYAPTEIIDARYKPIEVIGARYAPEKESGATYA